ncbi:HDOD domain-containing protein [Gemmatimonas sp.]|uniref:HDOD domain-containing protein n=1 Tax=Gemmatimonas sp. TaxID=1962908 RepID=UPI00356990FB
MLTTFLRRLFREVTSRLPWRSLVEQPAAIGAPSITVSAEVTSLTPTAGPRTIVELAELSLTYAPNDAWAERLAAAYELQSTHATESTSPDAIALLQPLAEGPDAVIRQMPAAAREALAICDDTTLSRRELSRRLERDPALMQGLLRTANSVAIGGGRAAVVGQDAVLDRIGVAGARGVVLANCVDGLLSHPGGEFTRLANETWAHMIRSAPIARAAAPAFAADADEAFTVALLHDVGKLVVFDRLSVLRAKRRRAVTLTPDFVHQLLQVLHEPLGSLGALQWGMGDRAATAIGTHHRVAASRGRHPLAEAIFFAERADHAARRHEPFDVDLAWSEGKLTGTVNRASSALQSLPTAA